MTNAFFPPVDEHAMRSADLEDGRTADVKRAGSEKGN